MSASQKVRSGPRGSRALTHILGATVLTGSVWSMSGCGPALIGGIAYAYGKEQEAKAIRYAADVGAGRQTGSQSYAPRASTPEWATWNVQEEYWNLDFGINDPHPVRHRANLQVCDKGLFFSWDRVPWGGQADSTAVAYRHISSVEVEEATGFRKWNGNSDSVHVRMSGGGTYTFGAHRRNPDTAHEIAQTILRHRNAALGN